MRKILAVRLGWRDVLLGLIFLAPPPVKKVLLRLCCRAEIAPTARIGWFSAVVGQRVVLGEFSRVAPFTLIRCGGHVALDGYAEVSSFVLVYGAGSFFLGRHSYVGPQSLINADEDVRIGNLSALGPRCMVFTHGSFLPCTEGYPVRLAGVTLGDRTWVAAGVFVHPGVRIGDDVFVNSCAVVSQDIPGGYVAEGAPARALHPLARLKRQMTPARVDEVVRRVLERFATTELRRELGLEVEAHGPVMHFRLRWRRYAIVHARATVAPNAPALGDLGRRARVIVVSNGSDPRIPPIRSGLIVVDLRAMRTPVPRDPIHARLVEFMRRYYGIHLEYDAWAEASSADRTGGLDDVDELEARRNMSLLSE
ncbi:MAG: transferase [Deltaproteobacteria bacterium]|nr:MAG: transferase [Deltaproteobacteria bacterium]